MKASPGDGGIYYLEFRTELLPQVQFDLAALLHIDQMSPVLRDSELLQETGVLRAAPSSSTIEAGGDPADVTADQTVNKRSISLTDQRSMPAHSCYLLSPVLANSTSFFTGFAFDSVGFETNIVFWLVDFPFLFF